MSKQGRLIIVTGEAGSGKTTEINRLREIYPNALVLDESCWNQNLPIIVGIRTSDPSDITIIHKELEEDID